jgi:hypothetical protein
MKNSRMCVCNNKVAADKNNTINAPKIAGIRRRLS